MSITLAQRQAELRARNDLAPAAPIPFLAPTPIQAPSLVRPEWLPPDAPLVVGDRPDVKVIVERHTRGKKKCKFQAKENDERCRCQRWMYVAKERLRYPLYTNDARTAEDRVRQYADCRDRSMVRALQRDQEWDAIHHFQRVEIADGFERFINARKIAKQASDSDDVIAKFKTMKKQFVSFVSDYNQRVNEGARVLSFDQITFDLLEHRWRPTWTVESYHSRQKFYGNLKTLFHYAQSHHWMPDGRKEGPYGCECLVCRMADVEGQESLQPKVPFNQDVKKHGGDPEWQVKIILRSCLERFGEVAKGRPNQHRRLATFMQVERYTGARISDVALMARSAVDLDSGWWRFQPLKTQKTTQRWVRVQLPPHVRERLRTLPPASDSHPDYFFWTGQSKKTTAADPWMRDLADLWPLVAPEAEFKHFTDTKGKKQLGIRDHMTHNMVKLSSHLFRNTFTVACRLKRMGWDRIAQLIGDDADTVQRYYGPYTPDIEESIAADLQETFPAQDPES